MKAAVITKDFQREIWDLPVPEVGDYDVLCEMKYGSTCGGTDLRLMHGGHPKPVSYPTILGHESIGRVVEVGKKVKNFHVGDLVTRVGAPEGLLPSLAANWGGFAQFGIAKDHWTMARDHVPLPAWDRYRVNQIIPDGIDEKTAPMLITWRETFSYVKRLGVQRGDKILMIGSGANALSLAAHCWNMDAEVWVVGSPAREALFCSCPVCNYYSYKEPDLQTHLADDGVKDLDYIIDGVGSSELVNRTLPCLKPHGTIAIYGWNDRSHAGINPFMAKSSFSVYAGNYDEEEVHGEVVSMVLKGMLSAELWYDMEQPVPLEKISDAYERLKEHQALKYLVALT